MANVRRIDGDLETVFNTEDLVVGNIYESCDTSEEGLGPFILAELVSTVDGSFIWGIELETGFGYDDLEEYEPYRLCDPIEVANE